MSEINNGEQLNATPVNEPAMVQKSFCKYCGSPITGSVAFCPSCGRQLGNTPVAQTAVPTAQQPTYAQPAPFYGQPVPQQPCVAATHVQPVMDAGTSNQNTTVIVQGESRSNGMGTAGFVFALLSFFVSWVIVVNWIVWFLGALFSFIGLFKKPRGLAIAGFIISFIDLIIIIAIAGAIAGFLSSVR